MERFSGLDITRETDKFPALSGLAKTCLLTRPKSEQHISGLWRTTFVWDMIWKWDPTPEPKPIPITYRAPSWSWASINETVNYVESDKHANLLTELVGADSNLKGKNHFGEVIGGQALLYGPVLEDRFLIDESERKPFTVKISQTEWQTYNFMDACTETHIIDANGSSHEISDVEDLGLTDGDAGSPDRRPLLTLRRSREQDFSHRAVTRANNNDLCCRLLILAFRPVRNRLTALLLSKPSNNEDGSERLGLCQLYPRRHRKGPRCSDLTKDEGKGPVDDQQRHNIRPDDETNKVGGNSHMAPSTDDIDNQSATSNYLFSQGSSDKESKNIGQQSVDKISQSSPRHKAPASPLDEPDNKKSPPVRIQIAQSGETGPMVPGDVEIAMAILALPKTVIKMI